jgi:tetratricopeptide (TPR) repeat protein
VKGFRRGRLVGGGCRWLAVAIAGLVLGPLSASAQGVGIPAIDRLPRYDWDLEQYELTDVVSADIKQAYRRGIEDLKEGNCRDAASKFEFILDFIDDDPAIYYVAATAARCARAFRAAAGYYESTIEFDPDHWDAHRFLGVTRLALGDLDEAGDVLATLDLERLECAEACPPELEAAYAELRGALEVARARGAED